MRIGIVGAGSMGAVHAAAWRAVAEREPEAELIGVCARLPEHAEALARRHGVRAFPGLDALLERVDVVDLCVPTDLHAAMTRRAAAAGVHVVCEKPMALTLADADAMTRACREAGVRLFVAMVVRFFPQYAAAAAEIAAGRLGEPGVTRLKRVAYRPSGEDDWFADEARSGGLLLDLMVHDLDVARWWGGLAREGDEPVRVFARSRRARRPDARGDYALVTLGFASGAMALVEGGWAYPPGAFRTAFDVAGRRGLLEWESESSEGVRPLLEPRPGEEGAARVGLPLTVFAEDPYLLELHHAYRAIRDGAPFDVTDDDARAALRLALAARASLASGAPVDPRSLEAGPGTSSGGAR